MKPIYWTFKKSQTEAKKYKSRKEFAINAPGAYAASLKNSWIDVVCSHMEYLGNRYMRKLYAFEFPDKSVYVGLTYNYKKRYQEHMYRKGLLFHKVKKLGTKFIEFNVLYPANEAANCERMLIKKYKRRGWLILNKRRGGQLGTSINKWPFDECVRVAKECETRNDFTKKYGGAYNSARRNGWLEKIRRHLPEKRILRGDKSHRFKWTFKKIKQEANRYKTRTDFHEKSPGAYNAAKKLGVYSKISGHMPAKAKMSDRKWSESLLSKIAKKYRTKSEFILNNKNAYKAAWRRNILEKICVHMQTIR